MLVLVVGSLVLGCGRRHARAPGGSPTGSSVEVSQDADHPRLGAVAREGDPAGAVAVAVAHDLGSVASASLAVALQARLARRGLPPRVTASENGFLVAGLAESPDEAARLVRALYQALTKPVRSAELTAAHRRRFEAMGFHRWTSPSRAAVGRCSGELGTPDHARFPDATRLERWRARAVSIESVAFAVVGSRPLVAMATSALGETGPWPSAREPEDPWPEADAVGLAPARLDERKLSIAIRTPSGSSAMEAATRLGRRDSVLGQRLSVLDPAWDLEATLGAIRPRGGCLRVDLTPRTAEPTLAGAAAAAQIALDALADQLDGVAGSPWSFDEAVLEASDPRTAASIAAWAALSRQAPEALPHRFVSLGVAAPRVEATDERAFAKALRNAAARRKSTTIDSRVRVEPGQGNLWVLLGTPCGTSLESVEDAGRLSLMARAVVRATPEIDGVSLEPWLTTDGVGWIAHAAPRSPDESPRALAERVATALARAVAGAPVAEDAAATTRARVLSQLDAGREGLWATALGALAPDHPSWLDPRGTWQTVSAQTRAGLEAERRALIAGPLRVAVLANADEAQAEVVSDTLQEWLWPARHEPGACPALPSVVARFGRYVVETPSKAPHQGARALVAVPLTPSPLTGVPREAEWTVALLNRKGGWLERALTAPGLVSNAEASALGGRQATALIIELSALEQGIDEAVSQTRALLSRLAEGAATEGDAAFARRYFERLDARTRFEPRERLVDTFHASTAAAEPSLASLRKMHRKALVPSRHIVVVTKPD